MLNTNEEIILLHILSLERSPQNTVSIGNQMKTYPKGTDEKELIRILSVLELHGLIRLKWIGVNHNSLDYAVNIIILPDGDAYFQNKEIIKKEKRQNDIRWRLTFSISIISLIWNMLNTIYTWYSNRGY